MDRTSVEQPFDIDRFSHASGTILAGTGLDTAVLGIDRALALPGHEASAAPAWARPEAATQALLNGVSVVFQGDGAVMLGGRRET